MKIVLLDGGLANQMTQYIFARSLQEHLKNSTEEVYFDDLWFYMQHGQLADQVRTTENHTYQLNKFPNIKKIKLMSEYFTPDVWQEIVNTAAKMPPMQGGSHLPQILKNFGFDFFMIAEPKTYQFDGKVAHMPYYYYIPEMLMTQGNVYYHGYFSHGDWFMQHEEMFRHELSLPPFASQKDQELLQQIEESLSISIHIRRGAYALMGMPTEFEWFSGSINSVCKAIERNNLTAHFKKNPHIFVFSDEIDWVKSHEKEYGLADLPYPVTYSEATRTDADNHCDMQLMSHCDFMILELRSMYSYMAALLNEKKQKVVLNPNKPRGVFK